MKKYLLSGLGVLLMSGMASAAMAEEGKHPRKDFPKPPSFEIIDKDGDGQISRTEFEAHRAEMHEKMAKRFKDKEGHKREHMKGEHPHKKDWKKPEAQKIEKPE